MPRERKAKSETKEPTLTQSCVPRILLRCIWRMAWSALLPSLLLETIKRNMGTLVEQHGDIRDAQMRTRSNAPGPAIQYDRSPQNGTRCHGSTPAISTKASEGRTRCPCTFWGASKTGMTRQRNSFRVPQRRRTHSKREERPTEAFKEMIKTSLLTSNLPA